MIKKQFFSDQCIIDCLMLEYGIKAATLTLIPVGADIDASVYKAWNNPHEAASFYKGYGKTEINREILAYYRHERIVEDIALYSQQLLLTTDGGKDREVLYKHFIDMFEPRGVVDSAFETDANL